MRSLIITFWGHACVAVDSDENRIVIDPGVLSDSRAVVGGEEILITHSHSDHMDTDLIVRQLATTATRVRGPQSVVDELAAAGAPRQQLSPVHAGQEWGVGTIPIRALEMRHESIHDEIASPANIGFLLDDRVLHPGDSLVVPDQSIDVLLLPVAAPWLALADTVVFLRGLHPTLAVPIHDAILSDSCKAVTDGLLSLVIGDTRF